jgi:hypothetical protein
MTCRACRHFENEPSRLEAMIPGLTAMGSAHASVRADDGICMVLDRMMTARDSCSRFSPRVTEDRGRP